MMAKVKDVMFWQWWKEDVEFGVSGSANIPLYIAMKWLNDELCIELLSHFAV
jgi:hypothetical protein